MLLLSGCINYYITYNFQVISKEGATSELDCGPCPAGRICPPLSTDSEPCNPGTTQFTGAMAEL